MKLSEFTALKAKVEHDKKNFAKAEGRLQQLMQELKEEFDCEAVESATAELDKRERKLKKLEARLNRLEAALQTPVPEKGTS